MSGHISIKKAALAGLIILGAIFMAPKLSLAEDNTYKKLAQWQYTIIHQVVVENPSSDAAKDIKITLPLMDNSSQAYQGFLGEQFLPWPEEIKVLENGSREALYNIPLLKAGERLVLEQRYAVSSFGLEYTFNPGGVLNDYLTLPPSRYLLPAKGIESDNGEIIAYAKEIAGEEKNPYRLARKAFADINLFLNYTEEGPGNQGALKTLRLGSGICDDYAGLFVAVMRALNIPARVQTGYLYSPKLHNAPPYTDCEKGYVNIGLLRHAWAEFYLPEIGWVTADPSFTYEVEINGKENKFVDWSYFASMPSARRYLIFREGGDSPDKISHNTKSGKCDISFNARLIFGNYVEPYNDINTHWAKEGVIDLHNRGLTAGVGEGRFGVNQNITRSQMAVFLSRMGLFANSETKTAFGDVPAGHWAYSQIYGAFAAGLMVGFEDGSFHPEDPLTRGEAAVILVRAFKLKMGEAKINFKDLNQPPWSYAAESIAILASNDITYGVSPGFYRPQKNLSRGEMAVLFSRLLKKQEE